MLVALGVGRLAKCRRYGSMWQEYSQVMLLYTTYHLRLVLEITSVPCHAHHMVSSFSIVSSQFVCLVTMRMYIA